MAHSSSAPSKWSRGWLLTALAIAAAACFPGAAAAQQGTVTGVVRDAGSQRPLDAVQVYIPGTGIGTLTNSSGRYLLSNVPAGEQTIQAERVGYATATQQVQVAAGQTATADLALRTSAIELNQIVVTGAGQATARKKLGNTVATVDVQKLQDAPINDVSQLLQGREAGVNISASGGMAGEASQIRIRGSASLTQNNNPIIYVDGVRIQRR